MCLRVSVMPEEDLRVGVWTRALCHLAVTDSDAQIHIAISGLRVSNLDFLLAATCMPVGRVHDTGSDSQTQAHVQ